MPSGRKRDKMTKIKNFNQSSDYFEEKPMSLIELNQNSALIDNPYENFIAMSRYAKWVPDENRRETWKETVDRYFSFMLGHLEENFNYTPDEILLSNLKDAVYKRNVMPSMRAVMTSGPALQRDNVAGYNC